MTEKKAAVCEHRGRGTDEDAVGIYHKWLFKSFQSNSLFSLFFFRRAEWKRTSQSGFHKKILEMFTRQTMNQVQIIEYHKKTTALMLEMNTWMVGEHSAGMICSSAVGNFRLFHTCARPGHLQRSESEKEKKRTHLLTMEQNNYNTEFHIRWNSRTYHHHLPVLDFSDKSGLLPVPLLHLHKLVSLHGEGRLQTETVSFFSGLIIWPQVSLMSVSRPAHTLTCRSSGVVSSNSSPSLEEISVFLKVLRVFITTLSPSWPITTVGLVTFPTCLVAKPTPEVELSRVLLQVFTDASYTVLHSEILDSTILHYIILQHPTVSHMTIQYATSENTTINTTLNVILYITLKYSV